MEKYQLSQSTIHDELYWVDHAIRRAAHEIEKDIANDISKNLKKTIQLSINKYNSDIFGIEDFVYKNNPKIYKKLKNLYQNELVKYLNINVNTNITIITQGNILKVV